MNKNNIFIFTNQGLLPLCFTINPVKLSRSWLWNDHPITGNSSAVFGKFFRWCKRGLVIPLHIYIGCKLQSKAFIRMGYLFFTYLILLFFFFFVTFALSLWRAATCFNLLRFCMRLLVNQKTSHFWILNFAV